MTAVRAGKGVNKSGKWSSADSRFGAILYGYGESKADGSAPLGGGIYFNLTVVIFYNAATDQEPESMAGFFGRKLFLEKHFFKVGGNPPAGIAYGNGVAIGVGPALGDDTDIPGAAGVFPDGIGGVIDEIVK